MLISSTMSMFIHMYIYMYVHRSSPIRGLEGGLHGIFHKAPQTRGSAKPAFANAEDEQAWKRSGGLSLQSEKNLKTLNPQRSRCFVLFSSGPSGLCFFVGFIGIATRANYHSPPFAIPFGDSQN